MCQLEDQGMVAIIVADLNTYVCFTIFVVVKILNYVSRVVLTTLQEMCTEITVAGTPLMESSLL